MLAGTGARAAPPKTGVIATIAGSMPSPPVAGVPDMEGTSGTTIVGAAMDAVEELGNGVANKSRKAVRSSLGSRGQGGMILMQVIRTFSRVCCMMVANPKFVK